MAKKINHLDEQQIIEAVIDERGLDAVLRRHLFECSACQAEKEALKAGSIGSVKFHAKGRPEHFRKPTISELWAGVFKPVWKIRPSLGVGVAFASILGPSSEPVDTQTGKGIYTLDAVYQEMLQDDKFMTEIEKLEENPLPRFYVDTDPDDDDKGDRTRRDERRRHCDPGWWIARCLRIPWVTLSSSFIAPGFCISLSSSSGSVST